MNTYELTVILRKKEFEATKEQVKKILEKNKASIALEDPWGLKKLAYEIKGENEANYLFFNIVSNPEAVLKITQAFKLNVNILRHLFVKGKLKEEITKTQQEAV